jgi:2-dehydro-3-deoxyphosphogluconate aldolase/(4S)-4-hydroxy-2-oxoglutarate aldolase
MASDATVLGSSPLIGIVRFREGGDVSGAVEAVVRGGVEVVEVTLDTPGALDAVERAAGNGTIVGAGTVLDEAQVHAAAAAGAQFVVSPGLIPEVIAAAQSAGIEPVPGVFTATEILAATAAGARVLKLFPASVGGPAQLRALGGPFPDTALIPTGGIRIEDVRAYLEAGAAAVALGSQLVGRAAPRSDADLEAIADRAARAVAEAGAPLTARER